MYGRFIFFFEKESHFKDVAGFKMFISTFIRNVHNLQFLPPFRRGGGCPHKPAPSSNLPPCSEDPPGSKTYGKDFAQKPET